MFRARCQKVLWLPQGKNSETPWSGVGCLSFPGVREIGLPSERVPTLLLAILSARWGPAGVSCAGRASDACPMAVCACMCVSDEETEAHTRGALATSEGTQAALLHIALCCCLTIILTV